LHASAWSSRCSRIEWTRVRTAGVRFRDESACRTCGEPCKRAGVAGGAYAYVGYGYSDRCAALAADRIFARDSLAAYLDRLRVAHEPFADLEDVARALTK